MRTWITLSAVGLAACGAGHHAARSGVPVGAVFGDPSDPEGVVVEGVAAGSCGAPTRVLLDHGHGHREPLGGRARLACVLGASVVLELEAAPPRTSAAVWILPAAGGAAARFEHRDFELTGQVVQVAPDVVAWPTVHGGACAVATFQASPPAVAYAPCAVAAPAPSCPDGPEDRDGFADEDGCADLDNDADGRPDVDDRCPDVAEDADHFEDADGCPDPDDDQDGVLDAADRCPTEPENHDGHQDTDGCPDRSGIRVEHTRVAPR